MMHVPGVTTQDQILGMGLVAISQRNVYPGGAEYGELGLSVVVRTGRDESGAELVAIRYFAVEMANRTTLTLSMRAASETKMNVTRAVISSDGLSLLLVSHQHGLLSSRPFLLKNARTHWLQATDMESPYDTFRLNPLPLDFIEFPVSISSGNGRIRVVEGSTGTVQVMESVAICSSDEFTFRLVMTPDANQHSIDWNVFDYGTYQGYVFDRNIIRSSPSYSNPSLSRTVLLAEFCLPKPLSSCLTFQVSAWFDVDMNGFAAYLIEGNNSTVLAGANEGVSVNGKNNYLSGENCEADPVPPNWPFPLVIAYNVSNRVINLVYRLASGSATSVLTSATSVLTCRLSTRRVALSRK